MLKRIFNDYISQKNFYFLLLLILLIIFMCRNIDIAIMLFVSIIFAAALNPLVNKLEKKMKRPLATTIVLIGFFVLLSVFILPILYLSIYEIAEFAKEFPQYIVHLDDNITRFPLLKAIGVTHINLDFVTDTLANSSTDIFKNILNFVSEASAAFLYVFTSIVLIFFFLVDKNQVQNAIINVFPVEYREKTKNIIHTVYEKLSGYVWAQTLVSGSVWITMTIGLLVFKINYAILLGIIAGILSIIPIVGSAISLIICLIATYEMGVKTLVIVTILYSISHFIENHIVRPYVYSKFLKLHQIIIFLAIVIGAKYQGVLGVILGPPFAMALYILFEELYLKKMEEVVKLDE